MTRGAPSNPGSLPALPALPARLAGFLKHLNAGQTPPRKVTEAFETGVVFATLAGAEFDAAQVRMLGISECSGPARYIAASDLWALLPPTQSDWEQLQQALLQLGRYRFFCFAPGDAPVSVDLVYRRVCEGRIATPEFIWLRGRFIDVRETCDH